VAERQRSAVDEHGPGAVLERVAAADPHGGDADQHLPRPGSGRLGNLVDADVAGGVKPCCSHHRIVQWRLTVVERSRGRRAAT
jgi:hypothetical protein